MGSFLKEAVGVAKKMPKAAWVAAVILPGGFTAIGVYLAIKSVVDSKKDKKDEESKNSDSG